VSAALGLRVLPPAENRLAELESVSADKAKLLNYYETVIERGLTGFVEAGNALLKIRQGYLYRCQQYKSFDEYCRNRWGFGKSYASRLIGGFNAVQNLLPIDNRLPSCEAVTRKLLALSPDQQRLTWSKVLEEVTGDPTAKDVAKVRDEVLAAAKPVREVETEIIEPKPVRQPVVAQAASDEELDAEFNRGFPALVYGYLRSQFHARDRPAIIAKIIEWVQTELK
jgi:hypothetical protein